MVVVEEALTAGDELSGEVYGAVVENDCGFSSAVTVRLSVVARNEKVDSVVESTKLGDVSPLSRLDAVEYASIFVDVVFTELKLVTADKSNVLLLVVFCSITVATVVTFEELSVVVGFMLLLTLFNITDVESDAGIVRVSVAVLYELFPADVAELPSVAEIVAVSVVLPELSVCVVCEVCRSSLVAFRISPVVEGDTYTVADVAL